MPQSQTRITRASVKIERIAGINKLLGNWTRPAYNSDYHHPLAKLPRGKNKGNFILAVNESNTARTTAKEFTTGIRLKLIRELKSKFEFSLLDFTTSYEEQRNKELLLDYAEFLCPSLACCSSESIEREGVIISESRWMANTICEAVYNDLASSYRSQLERQRKWNEPEEVAKRKKKAALSRAKDKSLTKRERRAAREAASAQIKLRYPTPPIDTLEVSDEELPKRMGSTKNRPAKLPTIESSTSPSPSPESLPSTSHDSSPIASGSGSMIKKKQKQRNRPPIISSPEDSPNDFEIFSNSPEPIEKRRKLSTRFKSTRFTPSTLLANDIFSGSISDLSDFEFEEPTRCSASPETIKKKRKRPPKLSPELSPSSSVPPRETFAASTSINSLLNASTSRVQLESSTSSRVAVKVEEDMIRSNESDLAGPFFATSNLSFSASSSTAQSHLANENQDLKLSIAFQAEEIESLRSRLIESVAREEFYSTPRVTSSQIAPSSNLKKSHSNLDQLSLSTETTYKKQNMIDDGELSSEGVNKSKDKDKEVSFKLAMDAMQRVIDMDWD